MQKTKNKFLMLIILVLALGMFIINQSLVVHAKVVSSGKCGANVNWSLNDEGILTISGSGNMWGYSGGMFSMPGGPWKGYDVDKVVIQSGVTGVGAYSFYMMNISSVSIADGVTYIEDVHIIERGYDDIVGKLKNVGADIEYIDC